MVLREVRRTPDADEGPLESPSVDIRGASGCIGVAQERQPRHDTGVTAWNSYSYLFGPFLAFGGIALMVAILRWSSRRGASVVAAPAKPGSHTEYGLLVAVAAPATYIEGEVVRRQLEAAGLRATLAQTLDGPRIMVWPADEGKARALLKSSR